MYDIEISLPVCGVGKYSERLEYFKKVGLHNIGELKVSLKLLTGTKDIPGIADGWPENVDVENVSGEQDEVTSKVAKYYANMSPEYANNARWFLRVDDDSVTDISHLVRNLEKSYRWEDPVYCGTMLCDNLHKTDVDLMNDMKLLETEHNDGPIKLPIYHEWEASVVSQSVLRRVLTNEKAMLFLKKRSEYETGWCDVPFAIAARIVGVHVTQSPFMTKKALVSLLPVFGGNMSHIHYVAPDIDKNVCDIILNKIEKSEYESPFVDRSYIISNSEPFNFMGFVDFRKDGTIFPQSDQWSLWSFNENKLILYDKEGNVNAKMNPKDDCKYFIGENRYSEVMVLREIAGMKL